MGLLSKFLKNEGAKALESVGRDLLSKALGGENAPAQQTQARPAPAQEASVSEPDDPWDVMPAEENQYSYHGPYQAYFMDLFRADFPAYDVTQETCGRSTVCTFRQGGEKALVVELMTEKSSANRLRAECQRAGVPYLRFYYDHQGWWNTRSYVTGRVRAALGS